MTQTNFSYPPYITSDVKNFAELNTAITHENKLILKKIQNLNSNEKQSLLDYCLYTIYSIKARAYLSKTSDTITPKIKLFTKDKDDNLLYNGYHLSEKGNQIKILLLKVGINLSYDTNIEGTYNAIKASASNLIMSPEKAEVKLKQLLFSKN